MADHRNHGHQTVFRSFGSIASAAFTRSRGNRRPTTTSPTSFTRHTYASHLIGKGSELQYVQQQLGHHSPAFTLTVYGHLLPKDRRGLVNQLDEPAPAGSLWAPEDGTTVSASAPEATQSLVAQEVVAARPA